MQHNCLNIANHDTDYKSIGCGCQCDVFDWTLWMCKYIFFCLDTIHWSGFYILGHFKKASLKWECDKYTW